MLFQVVIIRHLRLRNLRSSNRTLCQTSSVNGAYKGLHAISINYITIPTYLYKGKVYTQWKQRGL